MKSMKKIPKYSLVLVILTFIGLFFRIIAAYFIPLTFDEAHNILMSRSDDLALTVKVVAAYYPPLYFIIWHFWQKLFINLFMVRILSVVFGILTILSVAYVSRKLFNQTVSLIATFLIATTPSLIFYSATARMYSLAIVITIWIIYYFIRIQTKPQLWYVFGLFWLLGLYTHYYFLILGIMLNFILIYNQKLQIIKIHRWLWLHIIILLSLIPILNNVLSGNKWVSVPFNTPLKLPIFYMSMLLPWDIIQNLPLINHKSFDWLSIFWLISSCFFLLTIILKFKKIFLHEVIIQLLFIFFFTPILLYLISNFLVPVFAVRSFIIFFPFFVLLTAYLVAECKSVIRSAWLFFITLLYVGIIIILLHQTNPNSQLYQHFDQSDIVVYNDIVLFLPSVFLNPPGEHWLLYSGHLDTTSLNILHISVTNLNQIPLNRNVWYVKQFTNWPLYEKEANKIENFLLEKFEQIEKYNYPHHQVISYKPKI